MRFPLYAAESPSRERWESATFEAELRAFVEDAVGPVELSQSKLRGWSTVWTADTPDGARFWAKQNCALNGAEAALLAVLVDLVPEQVVPVTALDPERGLVLLPDQGEVVGGEEDVEVWCRVVAAWAELQRGVLGDERRIREAGVPVVAVEDCLPMLLDRAEAMHALPADDPTRLSDADAARIAADHDVVRRSAEAVATLGLPLALNHNDLHGRNVFDHGGGLRFFDLGDAMLTTPGAALLTPLQGIRHSLGCAPDDPRLVRVADAWVEVWSDLVPAAELRRTLPDALRLAALSRHDSWLRALNAASPQELADWGDAAAYYLGQAVGPTLLVAAD